MKSRLLLVLLLVAGCATSTPEEREWKRAMEAENWRMCQLVYEQSNIETIHIDHGHGFGQYETSETIKSDLVHNRCRAILGDLWAE